MERPKRMTNIREYLNWDGIYSPINREERNLTAILYHLLLMGDNLSRFLSLIDCPFEVVNGELGIFVEYAYVRDLWFRITDNEIKRGLILALLAPTNGDELRDVSVEQFNSHFGAVPKPSVKYIQSPGMWSVPRFDSSIRDNEEFLRLCMFKWAFNAKPDIVIHTSRSQTVCVEAKLESAESQYPQAAKDKKIFQSRGLAYVKQTSLQKYLMEDLLGLETQFMFLVQKAAHKSDTHEVVVWRDVFQSLDTTVLPNFARETISSLEP